MSKTSELLGLPDKLEEIGPVNSWESFARMCIPSDVPEDDFCRRQCQRAYIAGYTSAALLWSRLERPDESDKRRKETVVRIVAEGIAEADRLEGRTFNG